MKKMIASTSTNIEKKPDFKHLCCLQNYFSPKISIPTDDQIITYFIRMNLNEIKKKYEKR